MIDTVLCARGNVNYLNGIINCENIIHDETLKWKKNIHYFAVLFIIDRKKPSTIDICK